MINLSQIIMIVVLMFSGVTMPQHNQHRLVPDVPTGYVLNPLKGPWSFLTAAAQVTNYITNPSAEVDTSGWFSGQSLFTRPTTAYRGKYSLGININPPFLLHIQGEYTESGLPTDNYTFGFAIRTEDTAYMRIEIFSQITNNVLADHRFYTLAGQWIYIVIPAVLPAIANDIFRFSFDREDGGQKQVLVDAMILTPTIRFPFSYFDGDSGFGYYWSGTPGLSRSFYTSVAGGGQIRNFDDLHFFIEAFTGAAMPTMDAQRTDYARIDGGGYQGSRAVERYIALIGRFTGANQWQLDRDMDTLIRYFNRDMTVGDTPLTLLYQAYNGRDPIGKLLSIRAVYVDGLEGTRDNLYSEKAIIRFRADDPFFYEFEQQNAVLANQQTLASVPYIMAADRYNRWSGLGSGLSGGRSAVIKRGTNGFLYVGGFFASAGGVANTANFAYWDGTAWRSAGVVNAAVTSMAVAGNGDIYVGGVFTSAGGVAVNRIARYRPSTNAWAALGTGIAPSGADSMAIDGTGLLYVGGNFATAGGIAAANLAIWNTNTNAWSAMPVGQPNNAVQAMAVDQSNALYIGGTFTSVAGGAVVTTAIAKMTAAGAWSALSTGMAGGVGEATRVRAIAIGANGLVYAGGNFVTAGGVTVNHIGMWTGTAWRALDTGIGFGALAAPDRGVFALAFDQNNILHVGGRYASAGRLTYIFEGLARWNGNAWILYDMDISGVPIIYSIVADVQGVVLGYDSVSSASTSVNTDVTVTATANTYPILTITNTDTQARRLYQIINETTGDSLWFDLLVLAGETITIDLTFLTKSITSTVRGDLNFSPIQGSQIGQWHLAPNRVNTINVFMGGTAPLINIRWNNAHWSTSNARY